jgi:hypothetical protein
MSLQNEQTFQLSMNPLTLNDCYDLITTKRKLIINIDNKDNCLIPNVKFTLTQIKHFKLGNTKLNGMLIDKHNNSHLQSGLITITQNHKLITLDNTSYNYQYQNIFGIWINFNYVQPAPTHKKISIDKAIQLNSKEIYTELINYFIKSYDIKKNFNLEETSDNESSCMNSDPDNFILVLFFEGLICQYQVHYSNIDGYPSDQKWMIINQKNKMYKCSIEEYFGIKETIEEEELFHGEENISLSNEINHTNNEEHSDPINDNISLYKEENKSGNNLYEIPVKVESYGEANTDWNSKQVNKAKINKEYNNQYKMIEQNQKNICQLISDVDKLETQIQNILSKLQSEEKQQIKNKKVNNKTACQTHRIERNKNIESIEIPKIKDISISISLDSIEDDELT